MKRVTECFLYNGGLHRIFTSTARDSRPCVAIHHCFGLLINAGALWVGAHYSPGHKRWRLNPLPCVTIWWTKPGGQLP